MSGGRRRVLRVPTSRGRSLRVRVISLVGVAPDRFPFSAHGLQPTIAPFVLSSHDSLHCHCVEIYFAGTELMMADFFTKPVDKTKFLECRDYLLTRAE